MEHLKDASLFNEIRLGCKGMPGTNTLGYYEHLYIVNVKSLLTLALGHIVIKLFSVHNLRILVMV
jgi:hypothetical protein